MGLSESKVVLQTLSDACEEAERQGSSQIDGFLQDPHVSYLPTDAPTSARVATTQHAKTV
jgi:hypothetical protein